MKKTVLAMISVLMVSTTFAQVSWDVRIGSNLSGLSQGDLTSKFGVKSGFGVEYAFSELFAIRPALFYSVKGASDGNTPFDFSPKNTTKLNYIEVPVLASFRFQVAEKFGITLNVGPSLGYCVSEKPVTFTELNYFDFGANMGLDFVFNTKFVVGVESQYGISELAKDSNMHNINYSLMFGYRF